jgi:hypothetical protein
VGPRAGLVDVKERQSLVFYFSGNEPLFLGHPNHSLVAVPISLLLSRWRLTTFFKV